MIEIFLILVFFGVQFALPILVAFHKDHKHRWLILFFNITFGTTGVVWVLLLLWAWGNFDNIFE